MEARTFNSLRALKLGKANSLGTGERPKKNGAGPRNPKNFFIATNGFWLRGPILQKFFYSDEWLFFYSDEWARLGRFRGPETSHPTRRKCFIFLHFYCFWAPKWQIFRRAPLYPVDAALDPFVHRGKRAHHRSFPLLRQCSGHYNFVLI